MRVSNLMRYGLHESMFEFTERKADNIKIFGYSPTHDQRVHLASVKVNIPDHMSRSISSVDIEEELNILINTQRLIRHEIKHNPISFVNFIRGNT